MRGLLPCPFCGWAAIMREWTSGMHYYRAECSNTEGCDCHGLQHLTLGEAIAAWNRRAEVRGEWVVIGMRPTGTKDTHYCSNCKAHGRKEMNYCPNCGAKMEDTP